MKYNLTNLIKSIDTTNLKTKIAIAIIRYSNDLEAKETALNSLDQEIDIDVLQLESMINPNKFDFPEINIDRVETDA